MTRKPYFLGMRRQEFSAWRRKRMMLPRALVFFIVATGFVVAGFQNQALFALPDDLLPLFRIVEWGIVAPLLLLAGLLTFLRANQTLTSAVQSAAIVSAVGGTLLLRHASLGEGIDYPSNISGVVLVAFAMFGGFNWERVALTALAFFACAGFTELSMAPQGQSAMPEVYTGFFMAVIAATGAFSNELLMRTVWKELMRTRAMKLKLSESDERFNAFMDHHPSIAWIKDGEGRFLYGNLAFQKFIGAEDDSWLGKTEADYQPAEFAAKSKALDEAALNADGPLETTGMATGADGSGQRHWSMVRFPITDGSGRRLIGGIATDVTEKKRAENTVRLQALTDELTGLYNRRGFTAAAEAGVSAAKSEGKRCALVFIDMDKLKAINHAHGHAGGDAAIMAVGEALRIACNHNDIIGRIGGDEFIVFTTECNGLASLNARISASIAQYSNTATTPFKLSATIGISEFDPAAPQTLEEYIQQADTLMFQNKKWKGREQ